MYRILMCVREHSDKRAGYYVGRALRGHLSGVGREFSIDQPA